VRELELEREADDYAGFGGPEVSISHIRKRLAVVMKRDRAVVATMFFRSLDVLVERGKLQIVQGLPTEASDKATSESSRKRKGRADATKTPEPPRNVSAAYMTDEERAALRYRSGESLALEKEREEDEQRLQARYMSPHKWLAWEFSPGVEASEASNLPTSISGHTDTTMQEIAAIEANGTDGKKTAVLAISEAEGSNKQMHGEESHKSAIVIAGETADPPRQPRGARLPLYYYGLEMRRATVEKVLGFSLNDTPCFGWHRELRLRKQSNPPKKDIFYYAPDGIQLRSRNEV
jgi:Methyl-CpG binding domain.